MCLSAVTLPSLYTANRIGEKMHALLVDDDTNTLTGLAELVAREGFTTAVASSLQTARERMLEQRPDVILLDLLLPDGDGLDLFQDLGDSINTEVIVITGHPSIETSIKSL